MELNNLEKALYKTHKSLAEVGCYEECEVLHLERCDHCGIWELQTRMLYDNDGFCVCPLCKDLCGY